MCNILFWWRTSVFSTLTRWWLKSDHTLTQCLLVCFSANRYPADRSSSQPQIGQDWLHLFTYGEIYGIIWGYSVPYMFENLIKTRVYSGESNEFTGSNISEALCDVQLEESDVSVFGLPSPLFLPAGSLYSVALTISLAASSGCDQLPLLGRLWRYRLVHWVLCCNLKINFVKRGSSRASTNRAVERK